MGEKGRGEELGVGVCDCASVRVRDARAVRVPSACRRSPLPQAGTACCGGRPPPPPPLQPPCHRPVASSAEASRCPLLAAAARRRRGAGGVAASVAVAASGRAGAVHGGGRSRQHAGRLARRRRAVGRRSRGDRESGPGRGDHEGGGTPVGAPVTPSRTATTAVTRSQGRPPSHGQRSRTPQVGPAGPSPGGVGMPRARSELSANKQGAVQTSHCTPF